jgi:hypothetical protein
MGSSWARRRVRIWVLRRCYERQRSVAIPLPVFLLFIFLVAEWGFCSAWSRNSRQSSRSPPPFFDIVHLNSFAMFSSHSCTDTHIFTHSFTHTHDSIVGSSCFPVLFPKPRRVRVRSDTPLLLVAFLTLPTFVLLPSCSEYDALMNICVCNYA